MPFALSYEKRGLVGPPAWSPDGSQIAFQRCDGKHDGVYDVPATVQFACVVDTVADNVGKDAKNAILARDVNACGTIRQHSCASVWLLLRF
jgi:hypothetical protein